MILEYGYSHRAEFIFFFLFCFNIATVRWRTVLRPRGARLGGARLIGR